MFTEKGYRRALMTDVGARLELSHALLYRYVESKEALFELALRYAMDPDAVSTLETPLPTPPPGRTLAVVKGWAKKRASFPVLGAALGASVPGDVADELGAIIDELYLFFEHNRRVLALIERSAPDIPELYRFYFLQRRRALLAQLAEYLARRMASGDLRSVSDVGVAARFLVESVVWFAWHRKDDPDSAMIGDEPARQVVKVLLLAAFVPPPTRRRRP
jgi:AcrR family transcriptional regulator